MAGYRIICVFGLVFSSISVSILILSMLFMRTQKSTRSVHGDVYYTDEITPYELSPIRALVKGISSLIIETYVFICINSLYLEIKEEGPFSRTQIPTHNVFINHPPTPQPQQQPQYQPVRSENAENQSPPSYNAAMLQAGYSTQVVIPMHQMHSNVSSFKPHPV